MRGILALAALALPLSTPIRAQSYEVELPLFTMAHSVGMAIPPPTTNPSPSLPTPISVPSAATVSFSSQGLEALKAMTGKKVKGVGLESVITCTSSPTPLKLPVGVIYQTAITHGISPIDPDVAEALIRRKVGFSIFNILPNVMSDGASGVAVLGAAKVISMSSPWLVGLVAASGTLNIVRSQIQAHAPDPMPLFKLLLDPAQTLAFPEPGCLRGMMVVRYKGRKSDNADGTFDIR